MILSLETSCDEVSAALVDSDFLVKKNIIFSSAAKANETGGVVPELAAREAANMIEEVLEVTLSGMDWNDIKAVAVTTEPGLMGSLLTGIESAKTISWIQKKPLLSVHHIFGHICANLLCSQKNLYRGLPKFPALVLTVSGGHNDIYCWKSPLEYKRIGHTLDDAAGECFDKCARMLGLGYPGGPHLSKCAVNGSAERFSFPRPLKHSGDFNFSFSGLKTALLYKLQDLGGEENIDDQTRADLAAGIESAIVEVLLHKLMKAQEKYSAKELHITGGVSANRLLRKHFEEQSIEKNLAYRIPEKMEYCTDNGAMIGAAAQLIGQYGDLD